MPWLCAFSVGDESFGLPISYWWLLRRHRQKHPVAGRGEPIGRTLALRTPPADALRARAAEPFTAQTEIGSGLLDGGMGWHPSDGHESGCAALMFVTQKSIGNFRRNAITETPYASSNEIVPICETELRDAERYFRVCAPVLSSMPSLRIFSHRFLRLMPSAAAVSAILPAWLRNACSMNSRSRASR